MNESLFRDLVTKAFASIFTLINAITQKRASKTYMFKEMLVKKYSADQKWESLDVDTRYVAADLVSMDSELPVKKRPSIGGMSGRLPKIGIKKTLMESDINAINIMKSQNATQEELIKLITDDTLACSTGIDEKIEMCFLQGLSDGEFAIEDGNNTGLLGRINFGYKDENTYGANILGKISQEDIEKVLQGADEKGDSIVAIAIATSTYNDMRKQEWAKKLVATYRGTSANATPSASFFDEAFADSYNGIKFIKIDRSIIVEKNGVKKSVKPFNKNRVIFLTTEQVGSLVWSYLAEKTNPVQNVEYATLDNFKLIGRFSQSDPLREVTHGQALVLPVIENVDQIYILDLTKGGTDPQEEGDNLFNYNGYTWLKSAVITACASQGLALASGISDEDLNKALNLLSDKVRKAVFNGLTYIKLGGGLLEFTASADSTGKTIAVDTNGATVTATDSADWTTITVDSTTHAVLVKVSANSEAQATARESTVTVTAATGLSLTFKVKQSA